MVDAALVEVLAEVLCATSAVLFTFIATFSRSPTAENIVQNIIFVLCCQPPPFFGGSRAWAESCGAPTTSLALWPCSV